MAKRSKLKVFRTAIGFHDAYVAAPSQKAALQAWGADRNLFAHGAAEVVTDEKLAKAPLAEPGVVLKVLRGTRAEQLAALGDTKPDARPGKHAAPKAVAVKAKRTPRPSRDKLEAAEAAIEQARARHHAEEAALRDKEARLKRKRDTFEKARRKEADTLQTQRDRADDAYRRALAKWRAG